jgi:hypothetical protein
MEAAGFDSTARARERSGEDDGAAKGEGVGGVGFRGIDFNPVVAGERYGFKPGAVRKECVAAEIGDGRFQMETARDRNGDDFVVVRSKNDGKLTKAFGVAARGEAHKELLADMQNVAAFESAGKGNIFELAELRERLGKGCGFAAARFRAERQNHRQFVQDNGRVFDEHGIGKLRFGGKRDDAGAKLFQNFFVGMMLRLRRGQVDRFPINEGKFAIDDGWADSAGDGGEHFERTSLHEKGRACGLAKRLRRISEDERLQHRRRDKVQGEVGHRSGVGNPKPGDASAKQHSNKNQANHCKDDPDI